MITAGIDMGMENVRVVILKDEKVVGRGKGVSGGAKRASAAEAALADALKEAGLIKKLLYGVKILGNGELTKKLTVEAAKFTEAARQKIEASGGKAEVK